VVRRAENLKQAVFRFLHVVLAVSGFFESTLAAAQPDAAVAPAGVLC
jgi:hypothetical protein